MPFSMNGFLCIAKPKTNPELQLAALIRNGRVKPLNDLIKRGVDINFRNKSGQTSLHISVLYSNTKCLKLLLRCKNIDKNAVDCCGASPLMRASCSGNFTLVSVLIKHGCSVNYRSSFNGTAAIHYTLSSLCCLIPTVDSINESITCHAVIKTMKTIQKHYFKSGKYTCLLLLLSSGADVNSLNKNGKTPLHLAIEEFNLEAIKILISHKANLDIQVKYKTPLLGLTFVTPVILAMHLKQLPVIHLLLECGCDVTQVWYTLSIKNNESVIFTYVTHVLQQPKTLRLMCRNRITTLIESPLTEAVQRLEIPVPLKKYLYQIKFHLNMYSGRLSDFVST